MAGVHNLRKGFHSFLTTTKSLAHIRTLGTAASSSPPNLRLDGKVAIVTGSTEGIGFAISRRLAQEGAYVVVSSRKEKNVEKAVSTLHKEGLNNVSGLICHVAKKADRDALVNHALGKYGQIDILVANAGMNPYFGRTLDISEESWDKIFDINFKSVFLLTQQVVPHMEKIGGGSIIYVSSFAGLNPVPEIGAYSISKTALLGLTKVIAAECGPNNIRVNCIAPGLIKTHLSEAMWTSDSVRKDYEEKTMLKRIGEPVEMSGLVAFLCSKDASYITGEVIPATGGISSRL